MSAGKIAWEMREKLARMAQASGRPLGNLTLADVYAADQIARLTAKIQEHNDQCADMCGTSKTGREQNIACASYVARGRLCPGCPRHYMIDTQDGVKA